MIFRLPGRNTSEAPHPFIRESVDLFSGLALPEKQKV
jgi:hypothetical protein